MRWYEIKANLILSDSDQVDEARGYCFKLPLDENMQLVNEDWKHGQRPYRVTRFWAGEQDLHGQLVPIVRKSWLIKYAYPARSDPTLQLGDEILQEGELLSIRDHADAMHTFRITSVKEVRWFPTAAKSGVQ